MAKIKLNQWFIKDNNLSISLMRYYVIICPIVSGSNLSYVLNVIDDENNKTLYFNTLEDAIRFTEDIISNSFNFETIINQYNEFLMKPKKLKKSK